MKKKILVTGSEGYIGTVLVPMLIEKNFDVVGIDSLFYSDGNLDQSNRLNYELIKKDIRDIDLEDLEGKNFYGIVHLAALSNDPLGTLNPELTYDINQHASIRLAEIAKKAGVEKFIYSSSCSLYGQGGQDALTEESESNPQTAYGKSKILAEKGIEKLADETFCPVYMRNATAFGFSPRMRFDLVVNSLCGFAKVDNEIKILGDGKPWRPLVHIRDISSVAIKLLEADADKIRNHAYNVGDNQENYQIKTIAQIVQEFYPECKITIAQKDAGDTRDYNVSFNKLNEHLGFKSEWSLKKGIEEIVTVFDRISLNSELFEDKKYTRLKKIEYLIKNNLIDQDLKEVGDSL